MIESGMETFGLLYPVRATGPLVFCSFLPDKNSASTHLPEFVSDGTLEASDRAGERG